MIGLHFWLRVRPWYSRLQPVALVLAVLVPVLSLLGMIEAGRHVAALAADPNWTHEAFARMTLPSPEAQRALKQITDGLSWFFGGVVAAVLLARVARRAWRRRHGVVRIGYPDGRSGRGHARHQRARGEPDRRDPARLGLRRPRPLLDLSRAGAR